MKKNLLNRSVNKSVIPTIPNEDLKMLAARIKPITRDDKQVARYIIGKISLRDQSFLWDAVLGEEATGLKSLMQIRTYHTYGYYGLFKPSIAEVISQIPHAARDHIVAFEITKRPSTSADLNEQRDALNAGYHVAMTTLYARA